MRYLLDTHLLLWWIGQSALISEPARERIANPRNHVFVSAVTLWEIRLKQSLGKLTVPESFEEAVVAQSFVLLPLRPEHTNGIVSLPWHHRDPFDRMLMAQAIEESLTLLTADEMLAQYGDFVHVVPKGKPE